jgi:hypothetical protein
MGIGKLDGGKDEGWTRKYVSGSCGGKERNGRYALT